MCVFYNRNVDDYKRYQGFMNILDEHRKLLKPLYYEDDGGKVLMVFYKKKLRKFKEIIRDADSSKILVDVLNSKHPYCSKCGCGYMTYYRYTYRDNRGCIGKSRECEVCRLYSDNAVRQIRDYARKRGTKRALLKVLNGKFFKEEYQDNDRTCPDDLPF